MRRVWGSETTLLALLSYNFNLIDLKLMHDLGLAIKFLFIVNKIIAVLFIYLFKLINIL